jgi:hypothetical protein
MSAQEQAEAEERVARAKKTTHQRLKEEQARNADLQAEVERLQALVDAAAEDDTDEGEGAYVVGTYSGISIVAPSGTKRARMARVANRIKDRIQDQRLRGTWTFTYNGLRLQGDRSG